MRFILQYLPKMLMAPEDASPGGGAAPGAGASGQAPAQGAAAPGLTADQVKGLFGDALKEQRNGIFADLRKAGVFKGGKDPEPPTTTSATEPKADATAPQTVDVQDIMRRERAFTRAIAPLGLTDGQLRRMEQAFESEKPTDVAKWCTEYCADVGIKAGTSAPPSPPGSPPAGANPQKPPVTGGGGSPPPPNVPIEEQDLLTMSQTDRDHLVKTKGLKWYRDTLQRQVGNKRFALVK